MKCMKSYLYVIVIIFYNEYFLLKMIQKSILFCTPLRKTFFNQEFVKGGVQKLLYSQYKIREKFYSYSHVLYSQYKIPVIHRKGIVSSTDYLIQGISPPFLDFHFSCMF